MQEVSGSIPLSSTSPHTANINLAESTLQAYKRTMGSAAGFSWDDAKSQACELERGFDFAYAARLWQHPVLEREDTRFPYGEVRIQALGRIEGIDFVVVYTWRGTKRHIISARRAHKKEVAKWQN